MPTYKYKCSKCGHKFEDYQKTYHEPKPDCVNCGSEETTKLMTFPLVIDIEGKFPTAARAKAWSAQKRKNVQTNLDRGHVIE